MALGECRRSVRRRCRNVSVAPAGRWQRRRGWSCRNPAADAHRADAQTYATTATNAAVDARQHAQNDAPRVSPTRATTATPTSPVPWKGPSICPTPSAPNILAAMGITGDHWSSSRWWANSAAEQAGAVTACSQRKAAGTDRDRPAPGATTAPPVPPVPPARRAARASSSAASSTSCQNSCAAQRFPAGELGQHRQPEQGLPADRRPGGWCIHLYPQPTRAGGICSPT